MNLIVDANVAVKWYIPEPGWARAQSIGRFEGVLAAPGHALGEIGHVLVQRFKEGKLSEQQLKLARITPPGTLLLIALGELFDLAMEIALQTGEAFYDALYVAAAVQYETVVATADAALIRKSRMSPWERFVMPLDDWSDQFVHRGWPPLGGKT